ncbi:uncharacterized protein UTRI_03952_B [Ustilago trichophora]|uniref:Uncharacterized protein n=1 Tax=Ustilago trichophora TaxID=86804 RepID=A0A5C3EAL4_9BASI|nr:uncharacterized protein UTRI_03952_B [Ustilago trichophora]
MSQSTPTATTKRKVMARIDSAPVESPSSSMTPNARPRIVRAHHGYSSPSLSNSATPTATRPTPGTGRARVDMSAFASPSSAASSPAMSPSVSSRPKSAVSAGPSTITARLSAPSPTVRSTPTFHARSGSTVGASTSSFRLADVRNDAPVDANLASLRSPKLRARNGSVDLSASPSIVSPSTRISANSQLSASMSLRSPIPRADQSQFQKPSNPSTSARTASAIPARHLLSPQRSQETLDRGAPTPKSRSPSPVLPAPAIAGAGPASAQHLSPAKQAPVYTQHTEPVVPDRQASMPVAVPTALSTLESTRAFNVPNGFSAPTEDQSIYAISPSEYRPAGNAGAGIRFEQGTPMTTGRASLRPGPALQQRSAMPPSFMDLASTASSRPTVEQRTSFASSTFSAHSASQPLSPSSETPRSPSETGEAEEARVHRKLLDLEITNKSLLAINSALEVTKMKQAREIRELKRRLREGRGLAITSRDSSSGGGGGGGGGGGMFSDDEYLETESDEDNEDEDEYLVREDPELEALHQRCKNLVDSMVEQARKAILSEYEASESTGGKVLHPAELEEMQREMEDADTTVATDVMESSMTFDDNHGMDGDASKAEDDLLPKSSSLKFEDDDSGASANFASRDSSQILKDSSSSGLHPNSAYTNNPLLADVSID